MPSKLRRLSGKILIPAIPVGIALMIVYGFNRGTFLTVLEPILIYSVLWPLMYLNEEEKIIPEVFLGILGTISTFLYGGYIFLYSDIYEYEETIVFIKWSAIIICASEIIISGFIELTKKRKTHIK